MEELGVPYQKNIYVPDNTITTIRKGTYTQGDEPHITTFVESYEEMRPEEKWTLTSGTYMDDMKVESIFSKADWKEIKCSIKPLPKDKHDHREKAEVLIIIEKSVTPEKCEEIVSNQNYDGSIELGNTVCNKLNALKEEIITAIQRIFKILKSPKFSRKY
ncbi:23411_t:CDS:2 [Gigaspora margarita]|uniref:23411_t:CDS:1 n=1 Tax=Gigaspora margarita TaxID=4874 RepID=A0ABN7W264_GIGMA|nr:23411_t:CDS:2 [Gigaspora margarita]